MKLDFNDDLTRAKVVGSALLVGVFAAMLLFPLAIQGISDTYADAEVRKTQTYRDTGCRIVNREAATPIHDLRTWNCSGNVSQQLVHK